MKKNVIRFAVAIIIVVIAVLTVNNSEKSYRTAGGGISLKEMADTVKSSVTVIAETNATTEQQLGQICGIANYEHNHSWYYIGADLVGCVSTEYNVACPTCDVRLGANFNFGKVEIKSGTFARNSVKTMGFDPQFSNFTINSGENYTAANATQISLITNSTKLYCGHKGSSFYKFNDGNYYVGAEQKIGNLSVAGCMDFAEVRSGYAAAKWQTKNSSLTLTANNIGLESKNYIFSYNRSNIAVSKKVGLNIASALFWGQNKSGVHTSLGFHKGSNNLFAQLGYTFGGSPLVGLGYSRKL